jgi:RNA-directed DNA polymerase
MKRAGNLIESIADMGNLRLAFWKARKGKSYANQVELYRKNLDENLLLLKTELLSGNVTVGDYRYFKIYEPKERQICASAFREQVLHHALINVCHEYFEKPLIFDTYASRKGKGTYAALKSAKNHCFQYKYYLKLDVKKFFESVAHDVLKAQLQHLFKDRVVLSIFFQIINSYAAKQNRGLPIGNLTSQYFANHYLSNLDHFIKRELHANAYVRYMDDMVVWHNDKAILKEIEQKIEYFVENNLKCELKASQLNFTSCGLPFLGYRLFPTKILLLQKSKQRFIKKMQWIDDKYNSGEWSESACQNHVLPLLAFVQHADTESFKKKVNHQKGLIA